MEDKPKPPANYLALAIISTIFCCQVFGIISIIYAAQVNTKYLSGDYAGAESASKNAKTWGIVSIGIGVVIIAVILLIYGAIIATAISREI
jgi:ABC-type multidrug transport system permease subunit